MNMIVAIIQARTNSTRLPNKILKKTNHKTILEHLVERIRHSKKIDRIIVATTVNKHDDIIVDLCKKNNIEIIRGSEEDVLGRYYQASNFAKADIVVRLTSDNPLLDHRIVDHAIEIFLEKKCDFVSNYSLDHTTYPHGFAVEVMSAKALEEANNEAKKPSDREHVVFFIKNQPNRFKIFQFDSESDFSDIRVTLDYQEDLEVISTIFNELYPKNPDFKMMDVILWLEKNPKIKKINSKIKPYLNILKSFEDDKKQGFM